MTSSLLLDQKTEAQFFHQRRQRRGLSTTALIFYFAHADQNHEALEAGQEVIQAELQKTKDPTNRTTRERSTETFLL